MALATSLVLVIFGLALSSATCPSLRPPTNGRVTCVDTNGAQRKCDSVSEIGTRAIYACNEFYRLSESANHFVICTEEGEWSESQVPRCVVECGKSSVPSTPLIYHGQPTDKGQWPWHVSLFARNKTSPSSWVYQCGGTLISRKLVITAAHCLAENQATSDPMKKEDLRIYFGKQLRDINQNEENIQLRTASKILLHHDYLPIGTSTTSADIALIVLNDPVVISYTVRPACLPPYDNPALVGYHLSSNSIGVVVGWGRDQTGQLTDDLRMAQMPFVSVKDCVDNFDTHSIFQPSSHTYCSGYTNGTTVCNGDSGGGQVFADKSGLGQRWILQGIVSFGLRDIKGACKTDSFVVFTKVWEFRDWIHFYVTLYGDSPSTSKPPSTGSPSSVGINKCASNRDKRTDIIHFVNNDYANIWLSDGNGSFTLRPNYAPWGGYAIQGRWYTVGDYNGDGGTDLIHFFGQQYVNVWTAKNDGTFDVTGGFTPWEGYNLLAGGYKVGDFNGDGKDDLVHFINDAYIHMWISNGNGTFNVLPGFDGTSKTYPIPPGNFSVGEFNGDGKADLIHFVENDHVDIWLSKGDGTFDIKTRYTPASDYPFVDGIVHFGDFNGDRLTDIFHVIGNKKIFTWISDGRGGFIVKEYKSTVDYYSSEYYVGDFNGDGKDDLAHFRRGTTVHIWTSNGDGTYSISGGYSPWPGYGLINGRWYVGDFNGDGKTDLSHFVGNSIVNTWLSKSDGTFDVKKDFLPWTNYDLVQGQWYLGQFNYGNNQCSNKPVRPLQFQPFIA